VILPDGTNVNHALVKDGCADGIGKLGGGGLSRLSIRLLPFNGSARIEQQGTATKLPWKRAFLIGRDKQSPRDMQSVFRLEPCDILSIPFTL